MHVVVDACATSVQVPALCPDYGAWRSIASFLDGRWSAPLPLPVLQCSVAPSLVHSTHPNCATPAIQHFTQASLDWAAAGNGSTSSGAHGAGGSELHSLLRAALRDPVAGLDGVPGGVQPSDLR